MPHYVKFGNIPRYRHSYDDRIYYEEVIGSESFEGPYSIVYHEKEPNSVETIKYEDKKIKLTDRVDIHTHLITGKARNKGDLFSGRTYLFGNDHISVGVSNVNKLSEDIMKMGDSHLLLFVHEGKGEIETLMGTIPFGNLDYILIPKGIPFRVNPDGEASFFFVESRDLIKFPSRYLNEEGQLKLQAPISDRNIRIPEFRYPNLKNYSIREDAGNKIINYSLKNDPLKVVGWEGSYYPFAYNALDQMPAVGRIHLPPPVHQIFDSRGFMVATFLPRPFDFYEKSIPISFYHSNVDVEEILFYSSGNFMSRKGIKRGSITIHVRNMTHGPHPGTYEKSVGKKGTDEVAVMLEIYDRIYFYNGADKIIDQNYPYSWLEK